MRAYVARSAERIYRVVVHGDGPRLRVELDGEAHTVELIPWLGTTHFHVSANGAARPVVIRRHGDVVFVTIGVDRYAVRIAADVPAARRSSAAGLAPTAVPVLSPMPGLVVAVDVNPGDRIVPGRAVAVMEAMKMQIEIRAPVAGRVQAVHVRPGQDVGGGAPLVTIETTG